MLNFKKVFNSKIISLVVAGLFLFQSTVYGIDRSNKSHLRPRISSNSEEGRKRLEDGLAAMLNLKGLTRRQHGLLNRALGTFFIDGKVREDIHVLTDEELAEVDPNTDLRNIKDLKVYRFTREQLQKALKNIGTSQKDIAYITANLISHPGRFRDEKGNPRARNLFILDEYLFTQLDTELRAQWAKHEWAHLRDGLKIVDEKVGLDFWRTDVEYVASENKVKAFYTLSPDPNLEAKSYGLTVASQWLSSQSFNLSNLRPSL